MSSALTLEEEDGVIGALLRAFAVTRGGLAASERGGESNSENLRVHRAVGPSSSASERMETDEGHVSAAGREEEQSGWLESADTETSSRRCISQSWRGERWMGGRDRRRKACREGSNAAAMPTLDNTHHA